MKRTRKILMDILIAAVLLPLVLIIAVRVPAIQEWASRRISSYLSEAVDGSIEMRRFEYRPFNTLIIKDILIKGPDMDTLLSVERVHLDVNIVSLLSDKLKANRIKISGSRLCIRRISDSTTNLAAFLDGLQSGESDTAGLPWKEISLNRFVLDRFSIRKDSTAVLDDLCFEIDKSFLKDGRFSCHFKDYQTSGKAREAVRRFNGIFRMCDTSAVIEGFKYDDVYSRLRVPYIEIGYGSLGAISDSTRDLRVKLILAESKAGFGSLAPLSGKYAGNGVCFTASGLIEGDLHTLETDNLHIVTDSGKSDISISGRIVMPEDNSMPEIDIDLSDSRFTLGDINRLIGQITGNDVIDFISGRPLNATIAADCRLKGNTSSVKGNGTVNIGGYGIMDFSLRGEKTYGTGYNMEGELNTHSLNLEFFGADFNSCILTAELNGSAFLGRENVYFIDDLKIDELMYNGYAYSGIRANGQFRKDHFKTSATSSDSCMTFSLFADCDHNGLDNGELSAFLNIEKADFKKTNFSERDIEMSMRARSNIKWNSDMNLIGQVDIFNIDGSIDARKFETGNISFRSEETDGIYSATIESDILNASYTGKCKAVEAFGEITRLLGRKAPNIFGMPEESGKATEADAEVTMTAGDMRDVLDVICPSLYVDRGTVVNLNLAGGDNSSLSIASSLLSYDKFFAKDLLLTANGSGGPLTANLSAGIFRIGQYQYSESNIGASLDSNTVDIRFRFDNGGKTGNEANASKADIKASVFLADTTAGDDVMIVDIHPSEVEINGSDVMFSPSRIRVGKKYTGIESFALSGTDGRFEADGRISPDIADTIKLTVNNFDLSTLNGFILDPDDNIQGYVTGTASASGVSGPNTAFFSSIKGREFCFGNTEMGEIDALCKWDAGNERINVLLYNTFNGKVPLNVSGWYDPAARNVNVNVCLDSLSLGFIPAIAPAVFSGMRGSVSGNINIAGPVDSVRITGSGTRLNNVYSMVEFTHVPYYLNGEFDVSEKGVDIGGIRLEDELGNKGTAHGGVYFNNFEETTLDMVFHADKMLVLNTTFQEDADGFYGRIFGTGDIRMHGPVKGLLIDIGAEAESGEVHIPVTDSYKRKNSLLTFVNSGRITSDAYDSLMIVKNIKENVSIDRVGTVTTTKLVATPATSLYVDMGGGTDMIKAAGNGTLEIVSGNNNFDIRGVYTVAEGSCRMSFLGISSKEFAILEGGTVNFNGDVDKTELNVSARYSTKASIETLIGDNSSVTSRRTVYSIINVSGNVYNPTIRFKVEIPDLEPSTKNRVENALSTDEKNLRQSLALLISGSFVPDENGGIVNGNTILYSNASEIVSNQISNIFHQLDIPVDLGFKYQPSNSGVNVFDVAVSTQLFHNRVTINGSIGNQQYMTGGASTDIVGNVDVEIKLNKSGKVRLNLFSHASDKYSNYLDETQRNGVGIIFQEEFNTWMELWNDILRRSRKQENR